MSKTESCWVPRSRQVIKRSEEGPGIVTLVVERQADDPMPAPGQFYMLYAFGVGEVPISVSRIEDDAIYHTIRDVGAVSHALTQLTVGSRLGTRGPFGKAWPDLPVSHDLLIIAGGLGIAPVRPLIDLATRHRQGASTHIVYGTRDPGGFLYQDEWDAWRDQGFELDLTVDRGTPEWRGHIGVVPGLLNYLKFSPESATAVVCGPEIMMRFTAERLRELGMPHQNIFVSMERNMKCAVGHCGHCQWGAPFVCKDGPVFSYDQVCNRIEVKEL